MAAEPQPSHLIPFVARIALRGGEHPFLQADKPLHQLEGRSGRIGRAHGAVKQRTPLVAEHLHVVVAPFAADQFVGIVRGRRDHHQDLPRRRLDGHHRSDFAAHKLLGEELQPRIDGADDRSARLGNRVVAPLHIGALDRPVGVDLLNFHPVPAPQHRFVGRLHAAHAHILACAVRRIAAQHFGAHFPHIAEQVAADFAGILAHGAIDRIESVEVEFVEAEFRLLGDEVGHQARGAGAHTGACELPLQLLARDAGHPAQLRRVESSAVELAVNDHQVVTLAALHEVFAVAVEHLPPRGVLHHMAQHVAFGQVVVTRVEKLQVGQPSGDDQKNHSHHDLKGPHPRMSVPSFDHTRTESLAVKSRARSQTKATATVLLTAKRRSVCPICCQESDSSRKKIRCCAATSTIR